MSEHTLGSLFNLIRSNRSAREENARSLECAKPLARPHYRVQLAAFDQEYRNELDAVVELPALLQYGMRLQEGWPYPSDEALEVFRAQVAHLARRPMKEIDQLPLRDILAVLEGQEPRIPPPEVPRSDDAKAIADIKVERLPRWAQVYYLARCARRVQKILLTDAPDPEDEELAGIDRAIAVAERSAATGKPEDQTEEIADFAYRRANGQTAKIVPYGEAHEIPLNDRLRYAVGNAALAARSCLAADQKAKRTHRFSSVCLESRPR